MVETETAWMPWATQLASLAHYQIYHVLLISKHKEVKRGKYEMVA